MSARIYILVDKIIGSTLISDAVKQQFPEHEVVAIFTEVEVSDAHKDPNVVSRAQHKLTELIPSIYETDLLVPTGPNWLVLIMGSVWFTADYPIEKLNLLQYNMSERCYCIMENPYIIGEEPENVSA
jgi:hypothetical protein